MNTNFYVDDGLVSLPTSEQAVDLMSRTQQALNLKGNIRLHEIISNSTEVMNAFPTEDLAKDFKCFHIGEEHLPVQHSLGLSWNLNADTFIFDIEPGVKPYTRRGILSTINSIFDSMGFIALITI